MGRGDRRMGDGLPDTGGPIDGADRDSDGQDRQDAREWERSKDVPRVPAIDDRRCERERVRNRLWHRAATQRAGEHENGEDGDFRDSRPNRAEKPPDAVNDQFWKRAGFWDRVLG